MAKPFDVPNEWSHNGPSKRNIEGKKMSEEEIKQALKDFEEIEARKAANKARAKR